MNMVERRRLRARLLLGVAIAAWAAIATLTSHTGTQTATAAASRTLRGGIRDSSSIAAADVAPRRPPPAPRWSAPPRRLQEQGPAGNEEGPAGDCTDIDQGHNCDEWFASRPDEYTCEFLEGMGFDCSGCACGEEVEEPPSFEYEDYMEEEPLVEGKTAENVLAGVIVFIFVAIFCVMVHNQRSKGAVKGHWLKQLFGFAGSSGTTAINKRSPAPKAALKAVGALAHMSHSALAKRKMRALDREMRNAKNASQRSDLLELMQMKLFKAIDDLVDDVEKEEEEAALEHGDEETAAKAVEKKSTRKLVETVRDLHAATAGPTLQDHQHAHLRKQALDGCAASHAVINEENERMLAAIKKMPVERSPSAPEH